MTACATARRYKARLLLAAAGATGALALVPVTALAGPNGNGWAWGTTASLGNGGTSPSYVPVAVTMPAEVTFTAISAGVDHSLALDTAARGWSWGYNFFGELGNGTTTDGYVPALVSMPAGVSLSAIAAGGHHSLALDSGGNAWAWGYNGEGQLGNGTTTESHVPVAVTMPAGVSFTAVGGGVNDALAVDTAGRAWAWGYNPYGELGNGTNNDAHVPVVVTMPAGVSFTAVSAGHYHSLALDTSGHAWAWGYNGDGELGNGTNTDSLTPVAVTMPPGVSFSAIAAADQHSAALDTLGRAWAWGGNTKGQLGNGTTTNATVPLPVTMPAGVTFSAIAAYDSHSLALDTTGGAWAWGYNGDGAIGNGTTTDSSTPAATTMPAGVTFSAIAAGQDHSLAIQASAPPPSVPETFWAPLLIAGGGAACAGVGWRRTRRRGNCADLN